MDKDYRSLRAVLRRAARAAGAGPRDARRQPRRLSWEFVYSQRRADAAGDTVASALLARLAELAWLVGAPRSAWSRRAFTAWDRAAGRAYHAAQLAWQDDTPLGKAFFAVLRASGDVVYGRRLADG